MSNISLHYSGGSGGFICLHILLETDRYFCSLEGLPFLSDLNFSNNFNYLKSKQWNINNTDNWKDNEAWPDNAKTENTDSIREKIFFYCNQFHPHNDSKTILLYTDVESQLTLSKFKNAHWYFNSRTVKRLPRWQTTYHTIKANHWNDNVDLLTEFDSLPKYQQEEILKSIPLDTIESVTNSSVIPVVNSEKILSTYAVLDNGIKVLPVVAEFYKKADYCIRLQDLINTSGKALLDLLELSHTEKHIKLINQWKKLHPPELLTNIGIN